MGKFTFYIMVMSGLMLIFYFGGIADNTGTSDFLNILLNIGDIKSSQLWDLILGPFGFFTLMGGLAILSSLFFRANPEQVYLIPIVTYFLSLGFDFLLIFNKVYSVNSVIAVLIFSPVFLLYIVTVVEWYRGKD